jgi:glycosyltransferase involved in cell wall biosynthesis
MPVTYSEYYDKQIGFLKLFFDTAENNSLLSLSSDILSQKRTRIRSTLNELLVWGRPYLLSNRGLQWPYDECARIAPDLEKVYRQGADKSAQKQALLFLSFLPVPNQWRWLSRAIDTLADDPEINNFLFTERQTIQAKLTEKSQKTFKLRHFIQILKSPCLPHEKGVIRIFSLPYLFLNKEVLKKISEYYIFLIEPPAGIIFRHAWYRVFTELADPCFFGLGGEEDRRFVAMQSNTQVISLAHGDFLTDVTPPDDSAVKDFDIVFNGTFDDMPRKRHVFMLELLKDRSLLTKKALIIGRGSLSNVETFKNEVDKLGLTDRVTVLSNIPRQDLPLYLARCQIGVHLALHENACRCVYEYFRADIPCVISSATAGVNNTLFNRETGQAGQDDQLPEIILNMLNHRDSYSPRKWFLNNSGSEHASRNLNGILADFSIENGYLWQNDIVPLDSSGASRYIKKDHYRQFIPEFQQLLAWLKPAINASIKLTVDEM